MHGLSRALIANMVAGVSEGFKKELEIQGVGFKAAIQGQKLNLSLGKSHPILFQIPPSVKDQRSRMGLKITIEGADKHLVGQTAADIRAFYPPEPLKARGSATQENRSAARKAKPSSKPCPHPTTSARSAIRRLRKKVAGTPERPRLAVHFSGRHVTAQVIDDSAGKTIASVHTTESELRSGQEQRAPISRPRPRSGNSSQNAELPRRLSGSFSIAAATSYHGKVKALAEAAREGGLEF